jgi:hypothetical protein
VNLGNVFEQSLVDLFDEKAEQVCGRSPICRDCTHDPTNALALSLARAAEARATDVPRASNPTPDVLLARLEHQAACVAAMRAHLPRESIVREPGRRRRLIPVRS